MPFFKDPVCGAVQGIVRVRNYITPRACEFKAWVLRTPSPPRPTLPCNFIRLIIIDISFCPLRCIGVAENQGCKV